jgi:hypothetical protein
MADVSLATAGASQVSGPARAPAAPVSSAASRPREPRYDTAVVAGQQVAARRPDPPGLVRVPAEDRQHRGVAGANAAIRRRSSPA